MPERLITPDDPDWHKAVDAPRAAKVEVVGAPRPSRTPVVAIGIRPVPDDSALWEVYDMQTQQPLSHRAIGAKTLRGRRDTLHEFTQALARREGFTYVPPMELRS